MATKEKKMNEPLANRFTSTDTFDYFVNFYIQSKKINEKIKIKIKIVIILQPEWMNLLSIVVDGLSNV